MREKFNHLYLDSHERKLLIHSLVELKNQLIQQGRYTDCIDELIFKVINGLPRRPSYGSLSQVAVKPQVHITRQAPPFTACTSVQIMPTAEQGQCMTRLLQCCVSITPFRALCRVVRMTSQRSLPTRTESTASH